MHLYIKIQCPDNTCGNIQDAKKATEMMLDQYSETHITDIMYAHVSPYGT